MDNDLNRAMAAPASVSFWTAEPEGYSEHEKLIWRLAQAAARGAWMYKELTEPASAPPVGRNSVPSREALAGAVARGWCAPANSNKTMDEALAWAIVDELQALLAAPQPVDAVQAVPELVTQLREYAGNSGYSHGDYADAMRQAADALDTAAGE